MEVTANPFGTVQFQPISVSHQVFNVLKSAIISGKLPPGSRMVETRLTEWLDVSRTPLREALRRLQQEGWVEPVASGGVQVARISPQEVRDLYVVRAGLEGILAHTACSRLQPDELDEIGQLTQDMEAAAARGDLPQVSDIGRRIHRLLALVADNRVADGLLQVLNDRLERYKNMSIVVPGRPEEAVADHRQILAALLAKDADGVERAMREHIRRGGRRIIEAIASGSIEESQVDAELSMP